MLFASWRKIFFSHWNIRTASHTDNSTALSRTYDRDRRNRSDETSNISPGGNHERRTYKNVTERSMADIQTSDSRFDGRFLMGTMHSDLTNLKLKVETGKPASTPGRWLTSRVMPARRASTVDVDRLVDLFGEMHSKSSDRLLSDSKLFLQTSSLWNSMQSRTKGRSLRRRTAIFLMRTSNKKRAAR